MGPRAGRERRPHRHALTFLRPVCPALKARGLTRGQRPDLEEELLRAVPLVAVTLTTTGQVNVLLSNGENLDAQVVKFSAPITFDAKGNPLKDSGRDLALLKIREPRIRLCRSRTRSPRSATSSTSWASRAWSGITSS
jgi:hypothetical protein